MNVLELRELLEDFDDDAEIRLATQPAWPLAFRVSGVVDGADGSAWEQSWDEEEPGGGPDHDTRAEDGFEAPKVVWIVEGGHPEDDSPYAPGWVFEAV